MRFAKQVFTAVLCTTFIAACSGGSGGSAEPGPPAPTLTGTAKIDESSASTIAGGVVDAIFAIGSQPAEVLGYLTGVPVPATTTSCVVAGSVAVSGQVADPTTLSADDRIVLQFSDCDDGAGQVLNGNYELDVNSFSGNLLQGRMHINATATFDGFRVVDGSETISLNGGATLDLDTTTPQTASGSVSGDALSVSDNTDMATITMFRAEVRHDTGVAPAAYTSSASGTLSSTLFAGDVRYSTPVPFLRFAGEYPFAGELLVTGANGASVRLLALDNTNARVQLDRGDGSGVVTEDTTWVDLADAARVNASGISGQVLRGPIHPGPEVEGQVNEEPFSATFRVLDAGNTAAADFESDHNGNFFVPLSPGEYTIVPDASAPILYPEEQTQVVIVPADGLADIILRFDTGIR